VALDTSTSLPFVPFNFLLATSKLILSFVSGHCSYLLATLTFAVTFLPPFVETSSSLMLFLKALLNSSRNKTV
jgi:hypothetical protein